MAKGVVWSSSKLVLSITVLITIGVGLTEGQPEAHFKCTVENATCHGLADYSNPNGTTLRHIQTLFNVKHLPDILGVNNLPINTTGSYSVGPNQAIKVPYPCRCSNQTGLSDRVPVYKIKRGDTLDDIATTVFARLVKYQQIQEANKAKIPDANNITAGDTIWIPLPCSCDEVDGSSVVHYAHVVIAGSTVEGIAQQYGTTQGILLSVNDMTDPKSLQAGQILDVPLKACSSSVRNDSLDSPLLVPNATYVYTANECVKCKCDSNYNASHPNTNQSINGPFALQWNAQRTSSLAT
ncbi:LysM domain [Sesbania bispinosa]|nr:LysM domain [Sesbania bispinosa]